MEYLSIKGIQSMKDPFDCLVLTFWEKLDVDQS